MLLYTYSGNIQYDKSFSIWGKVSDVDEKFNETEFSSKFCQKVTSDKKAVVKNEGMYVNEYILISYKKYY